MGTAEDTDYNLYENNKKLFKLTKEALKHQQVARESKSLIEQLRLGNINPGKSTKRLKKNIFDARGTKGNTSVFSKSL